MSRHEIVLIDSNLLLLYLVGSVNPARISRFKRTRSYTIEDYALLRRTLAQYKNWLTLPNILTEVSNLMDLDGQERQEARRLLQVFAQKSSEILIASQSAMELNLYLQVGLTDAAIFLAARNHSALVLTDDFDLYQNLDRQGLKAVKFSHLRAQDAT